MSVQICRICLKKGLGFEELGSGTYSHRYKLREIVPEIDIDILTNPTLCDICANMLDIAYTFKLKCLASEEIIIESITNANVKSALQNEVESVNNNINNIHINVDAVRMEDCSDHVGKRKGEDDENEDRTLKVIKQEHDDADSDVLFFNGKVGECAAKVTKGNLCLLSVGDIKQELESDENGKNGNKMSAVSRETNVIDASTDCIIKQETGFFYSTYDDDSLENECNGEVTSSGAGGTLLIGCKSSEAVSNDILMEHSYSVLKVNFEVAGFLTENVNTEVYHCNMCGDELMDEKSLNDHIKIHSSLNIVSDKLACEICGELQNREFINSHMDIHKFAKMISNDKMAEGGYLNISLDTEKKFMCWLCRRLFTNKFFYIDHMKEVHNAESSDSNAENVKVKCTVCNRSGNKKFIDLHMESHRMKKSNLDARILIIPSTSKEGSDLVCKKCGESFTDIKLLEAHNECHSNKIKCSICGELRDKASVKSHMEIHNIVEELVIDSDFDEAAVSVMDDEDSDNSSDAQQSQRNNYKCCDKEFRNLYLLHLHTTKSHGFTCYVCDLKFPNKQALGGHFRVHSSEKTHLCKECGKFFAQRGNLLRHIHFVHTTMMPYKCDKCGKRFKRNKYLEEHMRTHTQKYHCDECDEVFTQLKLLRKHWRSHLPHRHRCDMCQTVFTARSSLLRHKRDIHKVKIQRKRCYGIGEVVFEPVEKPADNRSLLKSVVSEKLRKK